MVCSAGDGLYEGPDGMCVAIGMVFDYRVGSPALTIPDGSQQGVLVIDIDDQ